MSLEQRLLKRLNAELGSTGDLSKSRKLVDKYIKKIDDLEGRVRFKIPSKTPKNYWFVRRFS